MIYVNIPLVLLRRKCVPARTTEIYLSNRNVAVRRS